jgi:hypothetical protein
MSIKNTLPMLLSGIALSFAFVLRSQSICFNFTNGTNSCFNLNELRKITFDANSMILHLWDGNMYSWNISTIDKYVYNESLSVTEEGHVTAYPNPSSSDVQLMFNLPKEDDIRIELFDSRGTLINEKKISNANPGLFQATLDLSQLNLGFYTLRIIGQNFSDVTKVMKN